jgi:hypothetical protein
MTKQFTHVTDSIYLVTDVIYNSKMFVIFAPDLRKALARRRKKVDEETRSDKNALK